MIEVEDMAPSASRVGLMKSKYPTVLLLEIRGISLQSKDII
jgi:hypothetical protein